MSTEQAVAPLSILWPCKGGDGPGICLQTSPQDVPAGLVPAEVPAGGGWRC